MLDEVEKIGLEKWTRERRRRVFWRLMVIGEGRDGDENRISSTSLKENEVGFCNVGRKEKERSF